MTRVSKSVVTDDIPWQLAAGKSDSYIAVQDGVEKPYDLLKTIFAGQVQLAQRYEDKERAHGEPMPSEADWGDLGSRTVQMRLHSLYGYMIREFSEAVQHLDAKPWKDNFRVTDRDEFVEEMGDTLHFFIEFCLVAGITPTELFDAYFRSWSKNRERQSSGY